MQEKQKALADASNPIMHKPKPLPPKEEVKEEAKEEVKEGGTETEGTEPMETDGNEEVPPPPEPMQTE